MFQRLGRSGLGDGVRQAIHCLKRHSRFFRGREAEILRIKPLIWHADHKLTAASNLFHVMHEGTGLPHITDCTQIMLFLLTLICSNCLYLIARAHLIIVTSSLLYIR